MIMKTISIQRTNLASAACIAGVALLLAACEHPPSLGPGEADFGNAVNHNIQAHVVNPTPTPEAGSAPYDGKRADRNLKRYQVDNVKKPSKLTTSSANTGGGGGGGGND